jgi:hypothetical protein
VADDRDEPVREGLSDDERRLAALLVERFGRLAAPAKPRRPGDETADEETDT